MAEYSHFLAHYAIEAEKINTPAMRLVESRMVGRAFIRQWAGRPRRPRAYQRPPLEALLVRPPQVDISLLQQSRLSPRAYMTFIDASGICATQQAMAADYSTRELISFDAFCQMRRRQRTAHFVAIRMMLRAATSMRPHRYRSRNFYWPGRHRRRPMPPLGATKSNRPQSREAFRHARRCPLPRETVNNRIPQSISSRRRKAWAFLRWTAIKAMRY